jgi:hypothetical protein
MTCMTLIFIFVDYLMQWYRTSVEHDDYQLR